METNLDFEWGAMVFTVELVVFVTEELGFGLRNGGNDIAKGDVLEAFVLADFIVWKLRHLQKIGKYGFRLAP